MPSLKGLKAMRNAGRPKPMEMPEPTAAAAGEPDGDEAPATDEHGERHATPEEIQAIVDGARNKIDGGAPQPELSALVAGMEDDGSAPAGCDQEIWTAAEDAVGEDAQDADRLLLVAHVYEALGGEVPETDGGPDSDTDDLGSDEMGGALSGDGGEGAED